MTVWMVRAGSEGEQEQEAYDGNIVTIHWQEFDDLSAIHDKEALKKLYSEKSPHASTMQVAAGAGQVWAFCKKMEVGDLAVLPLHAPEHPKAPPEKFAIGEVTGPYGYRPEGKEIEITHTRDVRWLGVIAADDFPQDLHLGIPLTVYRLGRDDAVARIQAVLRGDEYVGPDFDALGEAGDTDDGEDARTKLQELAEAADLDPDNYDTWATLAEALKGGNGALRPLGGIRKTQSPRVNGGSLAKVLETVRAIIAKCRDKKKNLSEADTKAALIDPVLRDLGWPVGNLDEVSQEFRLKPSDNPVDYAMFILGSNIPILLVEAKALGQNLDRCAHQIMGYAGVCGVTWVVLTDGDEYRIYHATVPVPFDQKLFRAVRLTDPNSPATETLALLSREQIGGLHGLWDKERDDVQVRAAVEKLFSPEPHPDLLRFVKKEVTGLNPAQIKASLARVCETVTIP